VGIQKTGKEVGRREERGVGMGGLQGYRAAGSKMDKVHRTALGGKREMWAVYAMWYFAIMNLIGGIASMLWSGSTGVVWNVLLMQHMATF